ncbi:MAG: elongation factor P 5-aminopentanone reductase [Clostridia bacterium]
MSKVIIVTGGSRGIGQAIVEELARQNQNQIILNYCHSKDQAELIQKKLKKEGFEIDIYQADISKQEEVNQMINDIEKKYKTIDVLINNAGIDQFKLFTDITKEDWSTMLDINLTSAFYTSQKVAKKMIENKKGCIINISSIWGITGASCEVHYSVSKAGLDGMTKALAKELGPSNIRVNSIAPGIIDTKMNDRLTLEELEMVKSNIPLGKIGEPTAIVKCIKWLIEDDYTTGQVISINGGWYI